MRTCLMYHAACKVKFQPFKRSYSQLTFFNLKKKITANTYDNGNAMFQGYLSKIFKKKKPAEDTFGVFEKFETFFSKICAHSERYRNLLASIFEILTFCGNIAFPLSPV